MAVLTEFDFPPLVRLCHGSLDQGVVLSCCRAIDPG